MMIKRSLSESGCPPHIIDDLMENCHERRWPPGLSSLETRQNNRRLQVMFYTISLYVFCYAKFALPSISIPEFNYRASPRHYTFAQIIIKGVFVTTLSDTNGIHYRIFSIQA